MYSAPCKSLTTSVRVLLRLDERFFQIDRHQLYFLLVEGNKLDGK